MSGPEGLEVLFTAAQIERRVAELGRDISKSYGDAPLTVVGVLKGSVIFLADLVRQIESPLTYDFVQVASYGDRTVGQEPRLRIGAQTPLAGRNVLLVDDIADTGRTLQLVYELVRKEGPADLKVCVLLDKRGRRQVEMPVDFVGFAIPDRFVVGYGLDLAERWRNLPYLAAAVEPPEERPGAGRRL